MPTRVAINGFGRIGRAVLRTASERQADIEIVASDVDAVNDRLARVEQIKRFDILDRDLSQADGELTPTLKVKRALVYRAFADRFARLYEG